MREGTDTARGRAGIEVLLVILATGAAVIENMVPRPLPFIKPGLANVVTVAAVVRYGLLTGLRVNILRSTGAALIMGTLATPAYLLSMAGGAASAAVMGTARKFFSIPGMSVAGSLSSLWVQLLAASALIPGLPVSSLLLPVSLWGLLSGAVTGFVAAVLLRMGFLSSAAAGVDSVCAPE